MSKATGRATVAEPFGGGSGGRTGAALVVVGSGTFLSALAGSAVVLALPEIGRDLGISLERSNWILQGFLLAVTVLLLLAGRLGDLLGHRRLYLLGFAIFGTASVACGLATGFWPLVVGRVLQGVGGALLMASGPALITLSVAPERRGSALGILATATYTGLTAGPPAGGVIVGTLGWRWLFLANAPIALLVIVLGLRLLPRLAARDRGSLDWPGAGTLLVGLSLLLLALSQGKAWGWGSTALLAVAAGALGFLALFLLIERRQRDPLLDLSLFSSPVLAGSAMAAVFNYVALFIPVVLLPFYLNEGLGMSAAATGLVLAAQPAVMAAVSSPAGSLSDRMGTRGPATLGMLIMAAALLAMCTLDRASGAGEVAWLLGILGLGTGLFIAPNSSALLGAAPRSRQGVAAGVLAESRNLGMLIGVAASALIYHGGGGQTGSEWRFGDFRALRAALGAAAAVSLLGALAAFSARRGARSRRREGRP